jgi:hypothetical protein
MRVIRGQASSGNQILRAARPDDGVKPAGGHLVLPELDDEPVTDDQERGHRER